MQTIQEQVCWLLIIDKNRWENIDLDSDNKFRNSQSPNANKPDWHLSDEPETQLPYCRPSLLARKRGRVRKTKHPTDIDWNCIGQFLLHYSSSWFINWARVEGRPWWPASCSRMTSEWRWSDALEWIQLRRSRHSATWCQRQNRFGREAILRRIDRDFACQRLTKGTCVIAFG